MPAALVAAHLAGGCVGIASIVALARAYLVTGRLAIGALAVPLAWVAMEFLAAFRSRNGAWWTVAYSQADLPAVIQVASWTGVWGVTALLLLPASTVAAVTAPAGTNAERVVVLTVAAAAIAAIMMYAVRRVRTTSEECIHVGLVAGAAAHVPITSPEGRDLADRYVEQSKALADRGARVIVLPEVAFSIGEGGIDAQMEPFARAAVDLGVHIVVGAVQGDGSTSANIAAVFGAGGGVPGRYQKQHLVPGLETSHQPGRDLLLVPVNGQQLGVLICKDLDFPELVRAYRGRGAQLLLAPAWDFVRDGWLHSRMAVLRGVESGVAVARVARDGQATISDGYGRILADVATDRCEAVDACVSLAMTTTVYARLGNWFGWTCVVASALIVLMLR